MLCLSVSDSKFNAVKESWQRLVMKKRRDIIKKGGVGKGIIC
jgi:hypothetical protein